MDIIYLIIGIFVLVAGLSLLFIAMSPGRATRSKTTAFKKKPPHQTSNTFDQRESRVPGGQKGTDSAVPGTGFVDDDSDRLELFSDELDLNLEDFDEVPSQVAGAFYDSASGVDDQAKIEFSCDFYEDSSSIIDYIRQTGTIDPSFEEYKRIKRVGSGTLISDRDNLSFHMGRKVYHYDCHKISDMKAGKNFIAVLIHGSNAVKLFIISDNTALIYRVPEFYRKFLSQLG
ncbi:MAG TPA: hypothetical protein PK859_05330 [Spirochaetota bacterium]|nr:hypothetical protein [Spirochaetota bacterium]